MSEILPSVAAPVLRLEPWRVAESVPRRSRGKSEVERLAIVDFRPLFPPADPDSRKRILPKSRLKSSQITKILDGVIL